MHPWLEGNDRVKAEFRLLEFSRCTAIHMNELIQKEANSKIDSMRQNSFKTFPLQTILF